MVCLIVLVRVAEVNKSHLGGPSPMGMWGQKAWFRHWIISCAGVTGERTKLRNWIRPNARKGLGEVGRGEGCGKVFLNWGEVGWVVGV